MTTILSTDRFRLVEKQLAAEAGRENVSSDQTSLALYSYDSSLGRARPEGVVRITDWRKLQPVVKILYDAGVPFVPRAAATSLSGGCVPLKGGVVLNLAPLTGIIEINTEKKYALVEPGVVNQHLQDRLAEFGYFYAPDPASSKVCTLGGNAGTNAGGPRCLKYGVTVNHVMAMDVVTPQGELKHFSADDPGPDFTALMTGSEGTLGVIARLWLRITELSPAVKTVLAAFGSIEGAIGAVSKMIAGGVVPCAIEALDRLTVSAVEAYAHAGYPMDAEAVLVIEFDGTAHETETEVKKAEAVCREFDLLHWQVAGDEVRRRKIWEGRRGAYAAMARLAPNVAVEDGVVPRPKLPEVLKEVRDITARHNIRAGLLFHAGDGNLHPNVIFDERNQFETNRVKKAGHEILKACVRAGGSVTGEHGVGLDKRVAMSWLFDADTLGLFRAVKDAVDPAGIANPDKILPVAGADDLLIRPAPPEFSAGAKKVIDTVRSRANMGAPSLITGTGSAIEDKVFRAHRGTALSLRAADAVLDWDRANYTITVEAGITLAALARLLAGEKAYLYAPPMPGTLGGALACRRWQGLRDLIIGARLLLSDGRVASFGGKVVKNAAGYDISRFLIGSQGAYGVILAATLKLSPYPFVGERHIPAFSFFTPNDYHRKLKAVFDPRNLFNPWIFGADND
ncbi:MAG: FAD-linked oxidase C-terminal domain-containing protein [Elusimicrobiaceae bacterium]|nr:FAD-linked oxidase C-terminal domain-containing protein [Elusimicrobiaceae bacterium]